jgi:protease IV
MEKQSNNFFSIIGAVGCVVLILMVLVFCSCMSIFMIFAAESSNVATKSSYKTSVLEKGQEDYKVGLVKIEGIIWDESDGVHETGLTSYLVDSLDTMIADDSYKAVIIEIDSPGGGVYDSARITDKILELKERGVVVVSYMKSLGASGGYWVAAPSDAIYVQPETFTGSIGVFIQTVDYEKLLDMIGIKEVYVTNKEGTNKVSNDYTNQDSEEYKIIQSILDENYEAFVSLIEDGRGVSRDNFGDLLDGRILSGRQAVTAGLADGFGGYDESFDFVKEQSEGKELHVIEFQRARLFGFNSFSAKLDSLYSQLTPQEPNTSLMALPEKTGY